MSINYPYFYAANQLIVNLKGSRSAVIGTFLFFLRLAVSRFIKLLLLLELVYIIFTGKVIGLFRERI